MSKLVRFKAGLGNQMFQYAFLRYLEKTIGVDNVIADFSYYTNAKSFKISMIYDFNIEVKHASNEDINKYCLFNHTQKPHSFLYRLYIFIEILLNRKYYFETDLRYHDDKELNKYNYYDGYWQSWRYPSLIRDSLIKEFTLSKLSVELNNLINEVQQNNSVFIGIRRGDYYSSKKARKRYEVYDKTYFEKAVLHILSKLDSPKFYVFSNDIEWVKNNVQLPNNCSFISQSCGLSDVDELVLMSKCKHGIISNSTYHWWAAWLIENDNKIIIRPKLWFGDGKKIDIFPPEWISLEDS